LGSLLFYNNAFTYFYVFIMPAALILAGVRFDQIRGRMLRSSTVGGILFLALMVVTVSITFVINHRFAVNLDERTGHETITDQREILSTVHRIFPEPVQYIDSRSVVASFPKVGFFMSEWGFTTYHKTEVPIFEELIRAQEPKFLLADRSWLVPDPEGPGDGGAVGEPWLFAEDAQALQANYVHHWGPIYIAGKEALARTSGLQHPSTRQHARRVA
jgi:hypothetical protein